MSIFAPKRHPIAVADDFKWSRVLAVTIPAVPVPQPRQRHAVRRMGSKMIATNYTPAGHAVNAYKATVRLIVGNEWRRAPVSCIVRVKATFVFDRPACLCKPRSPSCRLWADNAKDVDNLAKSTFDALNRLLWNDDRQVVSFVGKKVYRSLDESAHVLFELFVPQELLAAVPL
jgi:Holliday junction resolvase RusA-like endonuclease